jgi:hypothetical protein
MQGVRHVVDAARRNSSKHAAVSVRLARQCRMFLAVVAVKHTWTALTRVLLRRCGSEQEFVRCGMPEALLHAEAAQDVVRTLVGACELDNHGQSQTCLQRACCAAITTPGLQLIPGPHCQSHSFIEPTNALPLRHPAPHNQHSPPAGASQEAAIISAAAAAAAALPPPMPPLQACTASAPAPARTDAPRRSCCRRRRRCCCCCPLGWSIVAGLKRLELPQR